MHGTADSATGTRARPHAGTKGMAPRAASPTQKANRMVPSTLAVSREPAPWSGQTMPHAAKATAPLAHPTPPPSAAGTYTPGHRPPACNGHGHAPPPGPRTGLAAAPAPQNKMTNRKTQRDTHRGEPPGLGQELDTSGCKGAGRGGGGGGGGTKSSHAAWDKSFVALSDSQSVNRCLLELGNAGEW